MDAELPRKVVEIASLMAHAQEMFEAGRRKEAIEALEKRVTLIAELAPVKHPMYAKIVLELSWGYLQAGMPDRALQAFVQARDIIFAIHGDSTEHTDRVEHQMVDAAQRGGYSFLAIDVARLRLQRLREMGPSRAVDLAITLDELGQMLFRAGKFEEAILLFEEALPLFEIDGTAGLNKSICCTFLSRAHLHLTHLAEAVEWGRCALAAVEKTHGERSIRAAIAGDELAVALGFLAKDSASRDLATEAVSRSRRALELFAALDNAASPTLARSQDNARKLKQMVGPLLHADGVRAPTEIATTTQPFPTRMFVSHSYSDAALVERLKAVLPPYVAPIVFPALEGQVDQAVSDKLMSGVLGTDGMVCVDSEASRKSFWTVFERDLAARNGKKMFIFSPVDESVRPWRCRLPRLLVADLFAPEDADDAERIRRWLVDERSFEFLHGPGLAGDGDVPTLWKMPVNERQNILHNVGLNAGVHLVFLSSHAIGAAWRLDGVREFMKHWPLQTVLCFLERSVETDPHWSAVTRRLSPRNVHVFPRRPSQSTLEVNEVDNLMVRLYSGFHTLLTDGQTL